MRFWECRWKSSSRHGTARHEIAFSEAKSRDSGPGGLRARADIVFDAIGSVSALRDTLSWSSRATLNSRYR